MDLRTISFFHPVFRTFDKFHTFYGGVLRPWY